MHWGTVGGGADVTMLQRKLLEVGCGWREL
jgi:hypothetical protein